MSEKTLKTRIQNKRGTTAEWATGTAPNFVPLDGELVIYKDVNKIKIGDGSTKVGDLPFVASNGLDALTYSGIINVETIPQVGHTFSYAPAFASSFNRTPVVGDVLNVLVNHQSNSDSYMCTVEITEYASPTLKGTYINVTQATGKDGKNGVDALVWEGGVFYTRDNVAIGATVNMGPTSSFNRTPVAGDTYNVLLTQRDENDAEIASYFCQLKITQVVGGAFVSEITNLTKATGIDGKVKDVTLGGESMVNANGVVELQQTEMTDGCIPVWNNTEKIFIDSRCHNTVDGLQVEGNIGMYSSEHTLDVNVQDGSFSYSDDGQNTIKKYALPITKDSGTLAMRYEIQDKHFQPFAVGDDLSGQTLYFNNQAHFDQYFQAGYTILTSSGGYSIEVGGPPDITLKKNGTIVATFYTFGNSRWLESYTLPSDFGTIETLNSKGGSEVFSSNKPSIWYTLGLGPAEDYINIDVEDVYKKIPVVINSTNSISTTDALSANQGRLLALNKAPENHASTATRYGVSTSAKYGHVKIISGDLNGKTAQDGYAASQSHIHTQYALKANPSFTGNATIGGNLTVNGIATFQDEIKANGSAGTLGQVLTSQGASNSPQWKDIPAPSNMVTTDSLQSISGAKNFTGGIFLSSPVRDSSGFGATGQVLISQGENTPPKWSDIPTPSNMVTTDTNQTITGSKTFTGTLITEGVSARFTNAVIGGNGGLILDCSELQGTGDSIFSVWADGENKGAVYFGDGAVDVNISLGTSTYISSDFILSASSTSYPKAIVQKTGMTLLTFLPAINKAQTTTYGINDISRSIGDNGYTISLPSSGGTLALTKQIPIKTATLSGTTLSITLS